MEQETRYISILDATMKLGLGLGLYQIVKMVMFLLGMKATAAGMLFIVMALGVPFFAARLIRRFRDRECMGFLPFSVSWIITILTFLFATVLSSLAVYLYLRFIDNGAFSDAMVSGIDSYRQGLETADAGNAAGMAGQFDALKELFSTMTPTEMTKQFVGMSLFWGNLLSVVIALFTTSLKPKFK